MRRRRPSTAGLRVAGSAPHSGTTRCPVITAATPASIAARNGGRCIRSTSSGPIASVGSAWWESTWVSPWPGKCFTHAAAPDDWMPRTAAATCRETIPGSSPKARTPITGLRGSVFTSATGASTTFAPTASERSASARPTAAVASGSSTKPSCAAPGSVEPVVASTRVTLPPSSSMPTTRPGRMPRSSAASAARSAASPRLCENSTAPARPPSASSRRSHAGSDRPRNPGQSTPPTSARRAGSCAAFIP